MKLRPKTRNLCNGTKDRNKEKGDRVVNCRNPWFRQFWEQHFKCEFASSSASSSSRNNTSDNNNNGTSYVKKCMPNDTLTGYEQEGLVPFVGKFSLSRSHLRPLA